MKKLLFLSAFFISLSSFASNEGAYKLNDQKIDELFAGSQEMNLSSVNIENLMPASVADGSKSKIAAGLLGIFCGEFGIHRFYLGHTTAGLIYLAWTLCGGGIIFAIGIATLGFGFILYPFAYLSGAVGFVDGIIYLVTDDKDFDSKYVKNAKLIQWL